MLITFEIVEDDGIRTLTAEMLCVPRKGEYVWIEDGDKLLKHYVYDTGHHVISRGRPGTERHRVIVKLSVGVAV